MEYFYSIRDDEQIGPVTKEELTALFLSSSIDENALCWCEEMDDWAIISESPLWPSLNLARALRTTSSLDVSEILSASVESSAEVEEATGSNIDDLQISEFQKSEPATEVIEDAPFLPPPNAPPPPPPRPTIRPLPAAVDELDASPDDANVAAVPDRYSRRLTFRDQHLLKKALYLQQQNPDAQAILSGSSSSSQINKPAPLTAKAALKLDINQPSDPAKVEKVRRASALAANEPTVTGCMSIGQMQLFGSVTKTGWLYKQSKFLGRFAPCLNKNAARFVTYCFSQIQN